MAPNRAEQHVKPSEKEGKQVSQKVPGTVFPLRGKSIIKVYVLAACLFLIVPLSLSILGFLGAGDPEIKNNETINNQLIGFFVASDALPAWSIIAFSVMLLAGLASTMDSAFAAASSLGAVDVYQKYFSKGSLDSNKMLVVARISMFLLVAGGLVIALLPGLDLVTIFLIFITLRGCLAVPVVALLFGGEKVNHKSFFWSILFSFVVGFTLSTIGKYKSSTLLSVSGSILTIVIGFVVIWGYSRLYPKEARKSKLEVH
jgi:Na+/proline symporter